MRLVDAVPDLERLEAAFETVERLAPEAGPEAALVFAGRCAALQVKLTVLATRPPELRPAAEPDRLLDVREAAALLRMSTDYVRDHQAELGVIRQGNRLRFSERRLRAYIRERGTMRGR